MRLGAAAASRERERPEASAQGVGQHLLGEVAGEQVLLGAEELLQLGGALERPAAGQGAGRVDGEGAVLVAPAADRIEVLEGEAERVHAGVAGGAGGVL